MDTTTHNAPNYFLSMAQKASPKERQALIESISAIVSTLPEYSDKQEQAIDVLMVLIAEAAVSVRKKMAELLAHDKAAPRKLAKFMASDKEFVVAEPVLRHCLSLTDTDLIELMQNRSEEYVEAVAAREKVTKQLSQVIIDTEYPKAVKTLIGNEKALISEAGVTKIVSLAKKIQDLQEPLLNRPEITQELATQIYWYAGGQVRETIMNKFHVKAALIDKTIQSSIELNLKEKRSKSQIQDNSMIAHMLLKQGKLNSQALIRTLREKNFPLFCAMVAVKLNLGQECVATLIKSGNPGYLATLCQGMNISKIDFATLYLLTRSYAQNVSYNSVKRGSVTNPEDLRHVMSTYDEYKNDGYARSNISKWRENPDIISLLIATL